MVVEKKVRDVGGLKNERIGSERGKGKTSGGKWQVGKALL